MSVIVFDAGGTLMEYIGMPSSWVKYYYEGFRNIAKKVNKSITDDEINKSVEIMKSFNPRICYREIEYSPEYIFQHTLCHWNINYCLKSAIEDFFIGINLSVKIYPDVRPAIRSLKSQGHRIAILTDLPTAMPDELFRKHIADLLPYIDCYVSSQSCGYRKPNIFGLQKIAEQYNTPITELLFVGDEEKDKLTAHNAGCHFIHISRNSINDNDSIISIENIPELI